MTALATALRRPADAIVSDRLFLISSRLEALAVIVIALAILSPHFLTWSNGMNVLRQASLQFLMAAGLTLVDPRDAARAFRLALLLPAPRFERSLNTSGIRSQWASAWSRCSMARRTLRG